MDASRTGLGGRLRRWGSPELLARVAIALAIALRLVQYLTNRSLWADEAVLALNIRDRSYLELLQQLDYDQAAPIGFLWVEKLAIQTFGDNEYALRLFPLLCGIVSVFAFYALARRVLKGYGVAIALSFFAVLDYLLYYASEVKQYSTDVAVALGLTLLTLDLLARSPTERAIPKIAVYGGLGAVLIWFSHPAVLVAGGMAAFALLRTIQQRKWQRLPAFLAIFSLWGLSFLGFYLLSLAPLSQNETLSESWRKAFPPPGFDLAWLSDKWDDFFGNPLGFTRDRRSWAMGAWLVGAIALGRRNPRGLMLVLAPFLATLLATYLHQYPFRSRLLLFLTPYFILAIAEGIHVLARQRRWLWRILAIALYIWLIVNPFFEATASFVRPVAREEIRPVMAHVRDRQQPGDRLYVFQRGEYQFQYYAERFGYQPGDYIVGVDDLDDGKAVSAAEWQRYQADLDALRGSDRVWLIFSHIDSVDEERERVLDYLRLIGTQRDRYDRPGAFALLYDFTANADSTPR